MKLKRVIAWMLVIVLCLGLFAGCKKNKDGGAAVVDTSDLEAALEYVKTVYRKVSETTPADYKRIGVVPVNGVDYEVVWSVDVEEDVVKVVKTEGEKMVTIDVNEKITEETPYVLTATISDDYGNSVSHSWNHIVPAALSLEDMLEILKAAYALKSGESMGYDVTLQGKITQINTPWSDDYQNITVTIVVEGAEDMPVQCYRLKGEGAKELQIGDIITVTGMLKNYNGTIEFEAGCTLDAVIPGERVKAPDDPKQIVDEAYKLGANQSLPYEATLTGTITEVGTPYNAQYGNVTVTIVVDGRESKPIVCYRLKGTGADKIGVNDIITVKGYITNYVGSKGKSTIEFTAGCQLLKWEDRAAPTQPSDPKKVVDQAYALGANETLKYEATLTGRITKVNTAYDPSYGNVSVTMVIDGREAKPILCYRMKGTGVDKIGIGDTITVKGYITNYVGDKGYSTIEYNYPTLVSYTKNTTTAPTDSLEIVKAAYQLAIGAQLPYEATVTGKITEITSPYDIGYKNVTVIMVVPGAEDKPIKCYRLAGEGADKIGVGDTITVKGYIENYQHSSGDTEVEFVQGCKLVDWTDSGANTPEPEVTAITIAEAVAKGAAMEHNKYTAEKYSVTGTITEVYNTQYGNMYITDGNGNTLTLYGTYDEDGNRYDAMPTKPVAGDTITVEGPIGQYNGTPQMKNGVIVAHTPGSTDPDPSTPPVDPDPGVTPDPTGVVATLLTTAPADGDVVIIYNSGMAMTSAPSGNKMGAEAASVTSGTLPVTATMAQATVTVDGENYIFTIGGKYLTSGATGNSMSLEDTLTDCGKWTLEEVDTGKWHIMNVGANYNGNYNQAMEYYNGFTTYGVKDTEAYSMELYKVDGDAPVIPDPGPDEIASLTLTEANTMGAAMAHNTFTTDKYMVTGIITEIKSTQYGNMYIVDETGTTLYVYGVYNVDGTIRYDALETKPAVGDLITLAGVIGNYNGAQMKNGWIEAYTPATSVADAAAVGAAMAHNTFTSEHYVVTGKITNIANTTYGNMTIADDEGNTLYVYGTYAADGETRYDAMTTKPVVGDTVTLYGVMGNYNGAQMKNGLILVHVAGQSTDPGTGDGGNDPVTPPPAAGAYTIVDNVADLTEGTYKIAAYATDVTVSGNTTYFTDAPYHIWDGTISTGSNKDMVTNTYAFNESTGVLTKHADSTVNASKNGDAVDITLVAVEGKENTYYIQYGTQYVTSTYAKRALALSATPAEWVAEDCEDGGIVLHHSVDTGFVTLGFANAASNMIRCYKDSSGNMNTGIASGLYFFAAN